MLEMPDPLDEVVEQPLQLSDRMCLLHRTVSSCQVTPHYWFRLSPSGSRSLGWTSPLDDGTACSACSRPRTVCCWYLAQRDLVSSGRSGTSPVCPSVASGVGSLVLTW